MILSFDSISIGQHYSRKELAYMWGYQSTRAITRGAITPADSNQIVLFITRHKLKNQTPYLSDLEGDRLYIEGEKAHGSDTRLAGSAARGDEVHLFFREVYNQDFLYEGKIQLVEADLREKTPSRFVFQIMGRTK